MISKSESNMIERCYKAGLHIILQSEYITFKQALIRTKRESLKVRRLKLLTSFGQKALKNKKHGIWFCKAEQKQDTGRQRRHQPIQPLLKQVTCRTQRYQRSSLPFLTRLLSWHPPLVWSAPELN